MTENRHIIFFDGVCNLCNSSVQWVIARDKKRVFKFASLQGVFAQSTITDPSLKATDSIILRQNNRYWVKSSAVLLLLKLLGFPYNLSMVFWVVPRFIRDAVYDFVAKNRYKWYGKRDTCMMPDASTKDRFLE